MVLQDYAVKNRFFDTAKPLKATLGNKGTRVDAILSKKRLGSGKMAGHFMDRPQRRKPAPTMIISGGGLKPQR